jgi:hypothetical protein
VLAWFALPASAQQIPRVGLGARGARLVAEQGLGHHAPGPADHCGRALAAGDFTGDGRADLAIGIPSENTAVVDAGAVAVVPGTPQGLTGAARRLYPAGFPLGLIPDVETDSPLYGLGLASGDFDGNGFDDLAIGAPDRDDATAGADVGGAAVIFGTLFADDFESGGLRLWSASAP